MKKHLITLLIIASMLLYPAAAFAETEGVEGSEGQQAEAVVTEEAVASDAAEEATPEDIEEAAAEEEAVEEDLAEPEEAVEEAAAEPEEAASEVAEEAVTDEVEEAVPEKEEVTAAPAEEKAAPEKALLAEPAQTKEGAVQTGWNADRTVYYDSNGKPTTGLFKATMKDGVGALFYADGSGKVVKKSGIIKVSGSKTRFLRSKDSEGHWGFRKVSSSDKNDYTYFVGTSGEGAIAEESKFYTSGSKKYFVQSNGTVKMDEGFITTGGKKYFIRSNGTLKTGPGWIRYNNKKYRVQTKGTIRTQEGAFSVSGKRYVIMKDGSVCTKVGPASAKGKLYYVTDTKGVLGKYKSYKKGGKVYHVTKNGVIKVGRHTWKNKKYYYSTKGGYLKTKAGIVKQNGQRFHVNKGGLVTVNQKFTFNNRQYIAIKNGNIKTGLFTWHGTMYYAGKTGGLKLKAGIVTVGDYSYYAAAGGVVYVDQSFWSNGNLYVADKDGHLLSGFFNWKGYRHWADSEFALAVNKKFWVDGKLYIASSKGNIHTGVFDWGGSYYYADQQGVINTKEGLVTYGGKKFYNYNGGGLATEKWFLIDGRHYYAGEHAAFYTKGFRYNGVWIKSEEISSDGAVSEAAYQRAMKGGNEANAEG